MLQEPSLPDRTLEQHCVQALACAAWLNRTTALWHSTSHLSGQVLLQLHRANFDLWHLEDDARDPHASDAVIAGVKRAIDRVNQLRNDTVEHIDQTLLEKLSRSDLPRPDSPLHSETPGQIFDRLSILSLKIFHTAVEADRTDADEAHQNRNRSRLAALQKQQSDLAVCLEELWRDVVAGRRRIKLYRQYKMYNDPALNPILYRNPK